MKIFDAVLYLKKVFQYSLSMTLQKLDYYYKLDNVMS